VADRQGGEAAEALPAIGPWRHLSEMERSTPFRRQEWGEVAAAVRSPGSAAQNHEEP